MKLAILGGSFDPIHIGHLYLADEVICTLGYDRVVFVPAFQSPFKVGAEKASSKDRLDMLAAAIVGDPRLTFDTCEIKREGVSYTIDTLKDIISRFSPDGKPGLIIGSDLVSGFGKWQNPEEIAEMADIIVANRLLNSSQPATAVQAEGLQTEEAQKTQVSGGEQDNFPYRHKILGNEPLNVSSSIIREKIIQHTAWSYLVPIGARHIIDERKLYGSEGRFGSRDSALEGADYTDGSKSGFSEIIVKIEKDVCSRLSFERFIHSRNTAILAWDLCRRFGLDSEKGYLAGIAHDMCKSLDKEELWRLAHKDGSSISKLEQKKPGLLHGRSAAVLLKKKYGITDKDILDAIRYHTTGSWDMNALAKVVYIADKLEISREGLDPTLRKMSRESDLNSLFQAVLNSTVTYLRSRQLDISYGTRRLLLAMQKRNGHAKGEN